jgi:hypothetical protein
MVLCFDQITFERIQSKFEADYLLAEKMKEVVEIAQYGSEVVGKKL